MADPQPGYRVVRGPDWPPSSAEDGGEGSLGTVVDIPCRTAGGGNGEDSASAGASDPGRVIVQWDTGARSSYRCGDGGKYELRVVDTAPAGHRHIGVACSACGEQNIAGIVWTCQQCAGVGLCGQCYRSDKHELDHPFCACSDPAKAGLDVPCRSGAVQMETKGFFPGAEVCRVPSANTVQDSSKVDIIEVGMVTRLCGSDSDSADGSDRSMAVVVWETGEKENYPIGLEGKVSLKCRKTASGGVCYVEHLPLLGYTGPEETKGKADEEKEKEKGSGAEDESEELTDGCLVQMMDMDDGLLMAFQQQVDSWSPNMPDFAYAIGEVRSVRPDGGGVEVFYESEDRLLVWHPAVVTKVVRFKSGDNVRLIQEREIALKMMAKLGEADVSLQKHFSEVGQVLEQDEKNHGVNVKFGLSRVRVHPGCLVKMTSAELERQQQQSAQPSQQQLQPAPGSDGQNDLSSAPKSSLQVVSNEGQDQQMVNIGPLMENPAFIQFMAELMSPTPSQGGSQPAVDQNGSSSGQGGGGQALHSSLMNLVRSQLDTSDPKVQFVLGDKDIAGVLPTSMVIMFMGEGKVEQVKAFVNKNPQLVHDAISEHNVTLMHAAAELGSVLFIDLFVSHGSKLDMQDTAGDTPLHKAAQNGHPAAVARFLDLGARFSVRNKAGHLPLHMAAVSGSVATVKCIVEHGIKIGLSLKEQVESRSASLVSPLMFATDVGARGCVQQFVAYGADMDAEDHTGHTCLHMAVFGHNLAESGEPHETLISTGADPDRQADLINEIQNQLPFPLEKSNRMAAIACFLVQQGCDINYINHTGESPLGNCACDLTKEFLTQFSTSAAEKRSAFHGSDPLCNAASLQSEKVDVGAESPSHVAAVLPQTTPAGTSHAPQEQNTPEPAASQSETTSSAASQPETADLAASQSETTGSALPEKQENTELEPATSPSERLANSTEPEATLSTDVDHGGVAAGKPTSSPLSPAKRPPAREIRLACNFSSPLRKPAAADTADELQRSQSSPASSDATANSAADNPNSGGEQKSSET